MVERKHGHVARRACQCLKGLLRVERADRVGRAPAGNRIILLGYEIEIVCARSAQPAFEFTDPELHHVNVGQRPFGKPALGLGAAAIN
jgi:hypothetical protein